MAFSLAERKRDAIATTAIRPSRLVEIDGTNGGMNVVEANAGDRCIGVSPSGIHDKDTTNAADIGDQFEVLWDGIHKVEAGGVVSIGDALKPDADGKAVAAVATDLAVGIALSDAGADGEIITFQWLPHVV